MNRRTLLKGILITPLVGCLGSQKATRKVRVASATPRLLITFEGPFAVVMLQDHLDRVKVFTPRDPNNDHAFFIGGSEQDRAGRHILSLVAEPGALGNNSGPPDTSDKCFQRFNWNSGWDEMNTDDLAICDFPAPNAIRCGGHWLNVGFRNRDKATMPSALTLEYAVMDSSKTIKIEDQFSGKPFLPRRVDSTTALFDIEAGLPRPVPGGPDPDPEGKHAVRFFDDYVLSRFPALKSDPSKQLAWVPKKHPMGNYVSCGIGGIIVHVPVVG